MKVDLLYWDRVTVECPANPAHGWTSRGSAYVQMADGALRAWERESTEPRHALYARPTLVALTQSSATFTALWWASSACGSQASFDDLVRDGHALPVTVTCVF